MEIFRELQSNSDGIMVIRYSYMQMIRFEDTGRPDAAFPDERKIQGRRARAGPERDRIRDILHQPAGQLFDLEIDQTGRQLRHEDVRDQSPADRAADGSPARNVGSGKPQRTVAARWTALREHFTGSSDASWTGWYPEGFTSGSASRCPCSASCL